jgi:hypothetical protein
MDGAQATLRLQTVSDDAERSTSIASEFSLHPQAGLHPAALSWGSSGAGLPMHPLIARHHHHSSSCIANIFLTVLQRLPHTTLNKPSLVNSSAPDLLASNASKGNETLCSNLMPVIPSRWSVCAQQASRAKQGAERGATPNLIPPSSMASCFHQLCTSSCSREDVTRKRLYGHCLHSGSLK